MSVENENSLNPTEEKYIIFTVRDKRYALPSRIIGEVAVLQNVFPLPLVPHYVRGIINRYSIPYALIDISSLFSMDASDAKKVIVLKEEADKLALLIDDVTDIADLAPEKLIKTETEEASGAVSACFEWKGYSVLCLDAAELINRIKQDFEQRN